LSCIASHPTALTVIQHGAGSRACTAAAGGAQQQSAGSSAVRHLCALRHIHRVRARLACEGVLLCAAACIHVPDDHMLTMIMIVISAAACIHVPDGRMLIMILIVMCAAACIHVPDDHTLTMIMIVMSAAACCREVQRSFGMVVTHGRPRLYPGPSHMGSPAPFEQTGSALHLSNPTEEASVRARPSARAGPVTALTGLSSEGARARQTSG